MYIIFCRLQFFSVLLLCIQGFAQGSQYELPKYLPPSPTAAALARYGEIPVDISTGVPKIEIPIYTIKSRRLVVPLTLSYHASGIRVDDISTPAGLGWVVNGVGIVTRTVLDKADDLPLQKAAYKSREEFRNAVLALTNLSQEIDLGQQLKLDYVLNDKMSDRYYFQLPGSTSGNFRYSFVGDHCVLVPYQPLKVQKTLDARNRISEFELTDPNGNNFLFARPVATLQEYTSFNGLNVKDTVNTSWLLTRIISADKTDTITYEYHNLAQNVSTLIDISHSVKWNKVEVNPCVQPILQTDYSYQSDAIDIKYNRTSEPLLSKIVFSTGSVGFQYASDRQDIPGSYYRLTSISVSEKGNGVVRKIELDNDAYFGGEFTNTERPGSDPFPAPIDQSRRLKLKGVTIQTGAIYQKYSFGYEESIILPPYNTRDYWVSRYGIFARDYWGFYNGALSNGGLIPSEFVLCDANRPSCSSMYEGNRRPNHNYAKAGLIKTITYPTGGRTLFEFEPNVEPGSGRIVGGFRVSKIIGQPLDRTSESTKTYKYVVGGAPPIRQSMFSYSQRDFHYYPHLVCPESGSLGMYGMNIAINTYTTMSSPFTSLTWSSGSPIIYTNVIEYNGTQTANNGKTEHIYSHEVLDPLQGLDEYQLMYEDRLLRPYWYDNGAYQPKLIKKRVFKIENQTETLVSETINSYQYFRDNVYSTGVYILKLVEEYYESWGGDVPNSEPYINFDMGNPATRDVGGLNEYKGYIYNFEYANARASEKVFLLTRTEEKMYSDEHVITTATEYVYGNLSHLQPTEQTTVTSGGNVLKTEFKYPADFYGETFIYADMVMKNIVTPVIEQKSYRDSQFLQSVRTRYDYWSNGNIIAPLSVESKTGTSALETRLRYESYDDKGNVVTVSKENDIKHGYVWGYNKMYPIAHATNAAGKDIFHTSFEDGGGNSGIGKTGLKSLNGSFAKSLTGLTDGQYILSYWEGINNMWTLNKSIVNVSSNSFDINLSGRIDEVRFHPVGSQMVTRTYKPSAGVTSEADANGNVTTYQYDGLGRLTAVIDSEGNFVQLFDYKYKQ